MKKAATGRCIVALLGALAGPVSAQSLGPLEFQACLDRLSDYAVTRGVTPAVVERSLDTVAYDDRVIELDRGQPEFVTTFADYLGPRVSEARVEQGRELLARHRPLLERIYREYGVPPRYLVAFWALETNFGSYFGHMPVLDSLATLACDQRRSKFFTTQMVAALRIIEAGEMSPRRMEGSWAGAMGHMQFMPSVFLEYAVDYDGDGRRDLWGSLPDAMASAGNYLNSIGWESGWRWGREVQLPQGFPYELAGRDQARTLTAWRELGVRDAYDRALPGGEEKASLLVPSGHEGPKFLVYPNFEIIMEWNRSQFYALSVGRMADRLAGATALRQPPPEGPRLRRDHVIALQQTLNERGYESGPVDGIPGPKTRRAIREFQQANGMIADGYPSSRVLSELSLQVAETDTN